MTNGEPGWEEIRTADRHQILYWRFGTPDHWYGAVQAAEGSGYRAIGYIEDGINDLGTLAARTTAMTAVHHYANIHHGLTEATGQNE